MLDLVYVHGTVVRTFYYQPDEIGLWKVRVSLLFLLLGRLAVPQPAFSPRKPSWDSKKKVWRLISGITDSSEPAKGGWKAVVLTHALYFWSRLRQQRAPRRKAKRAALARYSSFMSETLSRSTDLRTPRANWASHEAPIGKAWKSLKFRLPSFTELIHPDPNLLS